MPEAEDEPLGFKIEVGVRPGAELGDYKGLEVGRADADVPDDVDRARAASGCARASPGSSRSSARPPRATSCWSTSRARSTASRSRAARRTTTCSSSAAGRLIEGFEEQLAGAEAGDERQVEVTFPDDYRAEHLAGSDAVFDVTVKEVREKVLPDLDDDFAAEASEFDTLEELRADIREKLGEAVGRADRAGLPHRGDRRRRRRRDGRAARGDRQPRARPSAGTGSSAS